MRRVQFSIRPFTDADADAVASWRYPPPYDAYDASEDPSFEAELRDPVRWGEFEFAVDDAASGELVGFLELTAIGDQGCVEIGLGLRPDLTGRGLGPAYIGAAMVFARERWHPSTFALDVFPWNERAIRAYERAGFERGEVYVRTFPDGNEVTFLRMSRPSDPSEA
jgi:[ribosomal protein S18]-alanine N-acetyltransferase